MNATSRDSEVDSFFSDFTERASPDLPECSTPLLEDKQPQPPTPANFTTPSVEFLEKIPPPPPLPRFYYDFVMRLWNL